MMKNQKAMLELLKEMKNDYGMIGLKGEFEAEGASFDELLRLRDLSRQADLPLAVKIGGCEAYTDICMARSLHVDAIIAPMIESAFAAKKYLSAINTAFPAQGGCRPEILINIETADGVRNLDKILGFKEVHDLSGLDIGRVDMAGSYDLKPEDSNGPLIYEACAKICDAWKKVCPDKPCTVGGFLSLETIRFLKELSERYPIQSESKKVIFSRETVRSGNLRAAFLKAIEFETLWYQDCMEYYAQLRTENWGYFTSLPAFADKL